MGCFIYSYEKESDGTMAVYSQSWVCLKRGFRNNEDIRVWQEKYQKEMDRTKPSVPKLKWVRATKGQQGWVCRWTVGEDWIQIATARREFGKWNLYMAKFMCGGLWRENEVWYRDARLADVKKYVEGTCMDRVKHLQSIFAQAQELIDFMNRYPSIKESK